MPKKDESKVKQISVNALQGLLKLARSTKNGVAELAGSLGAAIASAVENKHLHRKAFRSVIAEDRMEPAALADFYDAQDYYRDVLGLTERAKNAPRLPMEDDADNSDGKVTKLHQQAAE